MKRVLISFSVLFLAGCVAVPIPHDRQVTPLYYGKVVDAKTLSPIENVTITLRSLRKNPDTNQALSVKTKTDKNGQYKIKITESAIWYVIWIGPAEGLCGGKLIFEKPGYKTHEHQSKKFGAAVLDGSPCTMISQQYDVSLEKNTHTTE